MADRGTSPSGGRNVGEDRPVLPQDTEEGMTEARKKLAAARQKIEAAEAERAAKAERERAAKAEHERAAEAEERAWKTASERASPTQVDPETEQRLAKAKLLAAKAEADRLAKASDDQRTASAKAEPAQPKSGPRAYDIFTSPESDARSVPPSAGPVWDTGWRRPSDTPASAQRRGRSPPRYDPKGRTGHSPDDTWGKPTGWERPQEREQMAAQMGEMQDELELLREQLHHAMAGRIDAHGVLHPKRAENQGALNTREESHAPFDSGRAVPEQVRDVQGNSGGDGGDDPALNAVLQALSDRKKGNGTGFRVGNVVQKIPKLAPPEKTVADRMFQLAEFTRAFRRYVVGQLLTEQALTLFNQLISTSEELHRKYLALDEDEQDMFSVQDNVVLPTLDEDERKYFRILPGIIYDQLPEAVKTETVFLSGSKQLLGWYDMIAIMLCARRHYDVCTTRELEYLEAQARRAQGTDAEALRRWWITAQAAIELGHVSSSQVARGIVKLTDLWERFGVLLPREQRELSALVSDQKLTKFQVSGEAVEKVIRRMTRLVKETIARPKPGLKAHLAAALEEKEGWTVVEEALQDGDTSLATNPPQDSAGNGDNEPVTWHGLAVALAAKGGKGKGTPTGGKGGKGGQKGSGCYNCGSSEHWMRECPAPRKAHVSIEMWEGERAYRAQGDETDTQRTAEGACWKCGSLNHMKKQCPVWIAENEQRMRANAARPKPKARPKSRARLAQALVALLEEDGIDTTTTEQGNSSVPPPAKV